jgi:N-acetylmuramoyl-L-alanine amidase
MPRVLIEMGFVSNKDEGAFLNSDQGQNVLADAIASAVLDYKNEFFVLSKNDSNDEKENAVIPEKSAPIIKVETPEKVEISTASQKGIVFKVQISASSSKIDTVPSNFNGLQTISLEQQGKLYKYFYGAENKYDEAKSNLEEAKKKGYTSAFIVAYKDGVKISISDAIK